VSRARHFIVFHSNLDNDVRSSENLYLNRNDGELHESFATGAARRKWDVLISKLVGIILDDTFIFASITRWKSL